MIAPCIECGDRVRDEDEAVVDGVSEGVWCEKCSNLVCRKCADDLGDELCGLPFWVCRTCQEVEPEDYSDDICPCGDPDCARPSGHPVEEQREGDGGNEGDRYHS